MRSYFLTDKFVCDSEKVGIIRLWCLFFFCPRHMNYIILWLSTVGPVVGLNLPLSYAKLAPEQNTNADFVER